MMSPSVHTAELGLPGATNDPDEQPDQPTSGEHAPSSGLPRLLEGVPAQGAMDLQTHFDTHGAPPTPGRRERRGASVLIDRIEQAGLGGRGGAGFPMAKKMRAVAAGKGKPIVVVNAVEGEPASLKDRTLIETLPHLVLDGAAFAARAIGADEAILCVCETAGVAVERSERAIAERRQMPGYWPRVVLSVTPAGYVAGQESALVSHLNGGPPRPTFSPPMPFERGVRRRPTLVNNAETLAHVALIARHGPRWFRELGLPEQPGSALLTLTGPVAYPGLYEVEYGASLSSLLDAAGGTTERVRATLFGGYAGSWVEGDVLSELALSNAHLAPYGATLGAGVVLLLSKEACPVAETARVTRWLAQQGAGQCGPCVHGLDALAETFERMCAGTSNKHTAARVEQLAGLVSRRGACTHPDGTARFAMSALDVFAEEFADHVRHGVCEACARPSQMSLPNNPSIAAAA